MTFPKPKRRRLHSTDESQNNEQEDTSKPSSIFSPSGGREWTLSIALPGSIIANAQSHEQKTRLAGTIARALSVFCVDEIVIFEDEEKKKPSSSNSHQQRPPTTHNDEDSYTAISDPSHFLSHILSYLETPPYLRKHLFPIHRNLRTVGTLPSLDMPHHRANEWSEYREGITCTDPDKFLNKPGQRLSVIRTEVDVGLEEPVFLPFYAPPNRRITLRFVDGPDSLDWVDVVGPKDPRERSGLYWGYEVRRCESISAVFTECRFDGGYDLSFGTSERGQSLSELVFATKNGHPTGDGKVIPKFLHMIVVFGGLAGLEAAVKADPELRSKGVEEPKDLFDFWVNICPGQGSRTIRTEEAVWIALTGLRDIVLEYGQE